MPRPPATSLSSRWPLSSPDAGDRVVIHPVTGRWVRVRTAARRLPPPLAGLLVGALYGSLRALVGLLFEGRVDRADVLVTGVGWALIGWVGVALSRRADRSPGVRTASRAVLRGQLPQVPPADLRAGLLHVKRGHLRGGRLLTGVFTAADVAWLAFLRPSVIGGFAYAAAAFWLAVAAAGTWLVARARAATADRLLVELDARPGSAAD